MLLAALHPDFVRLEVDWSKLQPNPRAPPDLAAVADGCDRGTPPCGPFDGIATALGAIAASQHSNAGFEPVVVIDGVPAWAAIPAQGCERGGTLARSRPLTTAGLASYRSLIAAVAALADREGVELHYWSAWNEPNDAYFISPQRERCDARSRSLSPGVYAALVRAMRDELRSIGGDRRLVLGELAGFVKRPGSHATTVSDFVAGLPPDVVCAGSVWALHDYGSRYADPAAALAPLHELELALDRRGACGRGAHIWITETGAGGPNPAAAPDDRAAACRRLAAALSAWNADPRVDAAFQYTFREDPAFPVGLADSRLAGLFPSYYEWRAWGGRGPSDPAPAVVPQCAGG